MFDKHNYFAGLPMRLIFRAISKLEANFAFKHGVKHSCQNGPQIDELFSTGGMDHIYRRTQIQSQTGISMALEKKRDGYIPDE